MEGLVDFVLEVFVSYFLVRDGDEEAVAKVRGSVGGCVVEGVGGGPGVCGDEAGFDVGAGWVFCGCDEKDGHDS